MIRSSLAALIRSTLDSLLADGSIPKASYPEARVEDPKNPEHGDFACTFPLQASKLAGMNPRALGEMIAARLSQESAFAKVEVAGPGFINMTLAMDWVSQFVARAAVCDGESILENADHFARVVVDQPLRINVEFVSVNPNGPITIGSGRGAAYGSSLCNAFQAAGHTVHREYYINDGVNSEQMRQFALSVQSFALNLPFPEKGYKGDYVEELADKVIQSGVELPGQEDVTAWQELAQELMLARQKDDLTEFGVLFDTWFSEQALHDNGVVKQRIEQLIQQGVADTEPVRNKWVSQGKGKPMELVVESQVTDEDDAAGEGETLWLRSTLFGDDQDRVLRRRDGRLTYISSDVAYHADKFNRPANADKLITILGPDHHGYIGRLRAVLAALFKEDRTNEEALELAKKKLEVLIYQLVRFVKDGQPAPMRKRDGNIYAIRDLIHEIGEKVRPEGTQAEKTIAGRDVARFFYLMRSHDTTFDFDLDLAARQSDENPVFYVQYAHARISSVLAKAPANMTPPAKLTEEAEKALLLKILDLPNEIRRVAEDYSVNRLATYGIELARTFHTFYDRCRVILPEDEPTMAARIQLCKAARASLKATLDLLGVSAPLKMERTSPAENV